MRTLEITEDDAAELLDFLSAAGHGYSEYGGRDEDFEAVEAMEKRLRMFLYGAEDTPWVEKPPTPEEQAEIDRRTVYWKDVFGAFERHDTPFLKLISIPPSGEIKEITWGFSPPPEDD